MRSRTVSFSVTSGVPENVATPFGAEAAVAARSWPRPRNGLYCASEVRILVIDDDSAVCRVMQAALAPNDFKVETVSEPARAEEAIKGAPYHVIILDYVIPGLESEQVLAWLREYQA